MKQKSVNYYLNDPLLANLQIDSRWDPPNEFMSQCFDLLTLMLDKSKKTNLFQTPFFFILSFFLSFFLSYNNYAFMFLI